MRSSEAPPEDHHSFMEHERIVAAIEERDIEGASRAMYEHLRGVEYRLMGPTGRGTAALWGTQGAAR